MDRSHRKTARDLMWENGGPGVWAPDYREQYNLKDKDWRFDAIPEIIDGKNVADYVDPGIEKKLEELEMEEDQLMKELQAQRMGEEPESDLDSEEEAAVDAKRERSRKRGSRDAENVESDDAEMEDTTLSNTQAKKKKRSKSEAAKREASVTRGHSRPRDPSQVGLHT